MLSSFTMSLMASFLLGADGCISGMGSVAADLQADAVRGRPDRATSTSARAINDRLAPLVAVFYAPPFVDMHNRMKEALALLGRIPAAHVRPPLTPVSDDERQRIRLALRAAAFARAVPLDRCHPARERRRSQRPPPSGLSGLDAVAAPVRWPRRRDS